MALIKGIDVDFFYVETEEELSGLIEAIEYVEMIVLDTESYPDKKYGNKASGLDPHTSLLRLIQLNWIGSEYPYVVDLFKVDGVRLISSLNREGLTKVIHNAQHDLKVIYACSGIWLENVLCTMTASRTLAVSTGWRVAKMRGHSLKAISRDYADVILDKEEQLSDWSTKKLSISQLSYAARDVSEYILNMLINIREALCTPMPIGYGEEKAFLVDQNSIGPISRIEYEGMFINKELLSILIRESEKEMERYREKLCKSLGFPIEEEIVMGDDGELKLSAVIPARVAKLLNNNKDLVQYINKALDKTGASLTNLQAEALEETLSMLEDEDDENDPHKEDFDFGVELIKELLNYKKYAKLLSDIRKYDASTNVKTGRLYSNFNIVGAGTSRMSSSSSDGVNLQQINKFGMVTNVPYKTLGIDKEGEFKTYISLRHAFNHPDGHSVAVCVTGDTLINTSRGLRRADEIALKDTVITDGGPGKVVNVKVNPDRHVLKLTSRLGYEIEATPGHEFLTVENGELVYKQIRRLKADDWVVFHRNHNAAIQSNYLIDGKPIDPQQAYNMGFKFRELFPKKTLRRVPIEIMQSSHEIQASFLSGLYTAEGFIEKNGRTKYVAISSFTYDFAKQIQILLMNLGIVARRRPRVAEKGISTFSEYWVCISDYKEVDFFRKRIGFRDTFKKEVLDEAMAKDSKNYNKHCFIPRGVLEKLYKGAPLGSQLVSNTMEIGRRVGYVSWSYLNRAYTERPEAFDPAMYDILHGDLFFDRVKQVESEGIYTTVYDFTIAKLKRFTANGFIVHNCDYAGQELRVAAALSQDKVMLDAFITERDNPYITDEDGKFENPLVDLHTLAAMSIFPHLNNVPLRKLLKAAKEVSPNGQKYRDMAKVFNFSLIYGAVAASLAPSLNCSVDEAKSFLDSYFKKFHGLKRWLDKSARTARTQKWVENAIGRKIFVYESNNKGDANAVERKGPNALIQGLSSDMIKIALSKVVPEIEKLNWKRRLIDPSAKLGWIQGVVHDELIAILPGSPKLLDIKFDDKGVGTPITEPDPLSLEYANIIKVGMEEAMSELLSPLVGFDFPSKADPGIGYNWAVK